jgi:general secretion pathway protein D
VDDIPLVGDLLSNTDTDKITTEVILVVTPHIVRKLHPPQLAKHTLWSGTAQQYATKPQFMTNKQGSTSLYNDVGDVGGESTNQAVSTPPPFADESLAESKKATLEPPEPVQEGSKTSQPGASGLQVIPAAASIKIGEQISLTLQGQNFSSAERTSLVLTYDPAVLTFKQAIEGPFWKGQQVPPSLTISAVPNVGQLVIQMGQQGKPVQGSGALASIVFEATGIGASPIHIQNPTVLGANAQPVPVMVQHGRVWVE